MRDGISSAYEARMTPFGDLNDELGLPERYAREKAWGDDRQK